jgi:hypothetical protein
LPFRTKNVSFSSLIGRLAKDLRLLEKWLVGGNPGEKTDGPELDAQKPGLFYEKKNP